MKRKQEDETMLKGLLQKLIDTMQERNTVGRIIQSKDVKGTYKSEKNAMREQIERFREMSQQQINLDEIPICNAGAIVCTDIALELAFAVIMCKIDLYMTFSDQGAVLIEALSNDRGKYQSLSQNFVRFFKDEWQPEKITEAHALKKVGLL